MLAERNHSRQVSGQASSRGMVHFSTGDLLACEKSYPNKLDVMATSAFMLTFNPKDNWREIAALDKGVRCRISLTMREGMVVQMQYILLNATCNNVELTLTERQGKLFHLCRRSTDVFPPQLNSDLTADHFPGHGYPVVYSNTHRLTFTVWFKPQHTRSLAAKVSFSVLPALEKPQLEVVRLSPSRGE